MPDPRNEKNILPKRLMVKDNEGDLVVPSTLVTPKGFPKVWFYGRWSQRYAGRSQEGKKGKAIYYPKTKADQYAKTLWSLKGWGDSFDAPDPFGKVIPDGKFKGVWMGTTRSNLTIEAINRDDNNSFYDMVGVIRQFMDAQGMGIGDQPETSNLAQVANVPRSATIHLKVREIETMNSCLIAGLNGHITEFDDWETFDIKAERIKFKDVEEAKSFWHDAYFYFRLGLNLGFRAEEAFTLVAKKLDTSVIGSAKEGESGVFEFPNDDMSVTLYQRKAEKGKKGQKIHGGYIVDPETKSMVLKRLKDVEDAKNVSSEIALKKYGIVKEHNDLPYLQHSLIGADGRYTELGTLDLPASVFTEKEKERGTVKSTAQRSKVRAMMRHCYHEAGLKDDYWYKHSLHSVRHVFAQYWLSLSDYNYGFVADIGHWQTESIVKTVYGKKTDTATLAQMTKYAGENPIEKLRKQEQESSKAPSAVTQFSQQNYGSNEGDLQIQDKKLRQEIYFKGGYYYDVRLPDNERSTTQIYYPKGTDLAFKDKTLNKDKVLFKFATKIDSDQKEDLDK